MPPSSCARISATWGATSAAKRASKNNKRLRRAKRRADLLHQEVIEYYSNFRVSNDLIELRNLLEVADLIIQSALRRRESRGLHYTSDFPNKDRSQRAPTILIPDGYRPRGRDE